MRFEVELPIPPPYNHSVRHSAGRHYRSQQYAAWLRQAHGLITEALLECPGASYPVECWCRVIVELHTRSRRGDVDGYLKPILDALGGAHTGTGNGLVYVNDRQVLAAAIRVVSTGNREAVAVVLVSETEAPVDRRERRRRK